MLYSRPYKLLVLFLLLIQACHSFSSDEPQSNNETGVRSRIDTVKATEKHDYVWEKGVLCIDILNLKMNQSEVVFRNLEKARDSIVITSTYIVVDSQHCFFLNRSCNGFINSNNHIIMDLEFDLFIAEAFLKQGGIVLNMNGFDYQVDAGDNVLFAGYEQHFLGSLFTLDSLTPLYLAPNEQSSIIDNYSSYEYEAVGFKDRWMELKIDDVEYDTLITGWVKWKESDGSPLLWPIYMF